MAAAKRKPKAGRKTNGQFKAGSAAAKRAGRKGGQTTAKKNAACHAKKKNATRRKTNSRQGKLKL